MSTASPVPETVELDGDDARKTLESCGRWNLVRDAFVRLRVADGFSHARSMAWVTAMVFVEAIISVVGLATALGSGYVTNVIVRTLHAIAPGPAGDFLTDAVSQAHRAGATHRYAGLVFGVIATLISGSTFFGQFERGMNRIYGIEQDRPTLHKYGQALLFTVSVGVLASMAFVALAVGQSLGDALQNDAASTAWAIVRWPLGLAGLTLATTLLLRWSPRRRQPDFTWLAFGATVSVTLWTLSTVGLGLFFSLSTSFGRTYGPLAGVIALLLWALFSSVSMLFGGAVAAQLEAIRAGASTPQDPEKLEHSEPALAGVDR